MSELAKRRLGRTGLEVTTLGYGAMELRGAPRGPEVSDETAERVLNAVLDAGINFIDTSIDYGRSEEFDRPFHRASALGIFPGVQMWLRTRHAGRLRASSHARKYSKRHRAELAQDEDGPSGRGPVSSEPHSQGV